MSTKGLVSEPQLLQVLQLAENVRMQSLAILDLLETCHKRDAHAATEDKQLAVSKEQKQLNARLALLRSINRRVVLQVRAAKQETAEARQEIDGLHLELQNLYYEQSHLRSDILGCHEFDHRYCALPMIPLDEFVAQFPEHEESSEHDLTIARIQHESASRLALHNEKEVLQKKKDALIKETTAKKEELARVDAELESWFGKHETILQTLETKSWAISKSTEA